MNVFYKLRDWIDKRFLEKTAISVNPNAIDFLEENHSLVFPKFLSLNQSPKLIDLFIKHPNLFCIPVLSSSSNPVVINFLKENLNLINWRLLSENKDAISILENNLDQIDWDILCFNPNGMHIVEQNLNKINWDVLCESPYSLSILENNFDKINWKILSKNLNPNLKYILFEKLYKYNIKHNILKNSKSHKFNLDENNYWNYISRSPDPQNIEILEKNLNKINISELSRNPHPTAIKLLKKYLKNRNEWYDMSSYENLHKLQIDWMELCSNPNPEVIDILKDNRSRISWYDLSRNSSDAAIDFLEENIDKIDWNGLCENHNPRVVELFEKNINKIINKNVFNKIFLKVLSRNENIFEYDYQRMSIERTKIILEELMQKTWHPSKIKELLENGEDINNF